MRVYYKKLTETATTPTYGTQYSAGMDLYFDNAEAVTIEAGASYFCKTGIAMEIPQGYVGLMFARSGLSCNQGLAPANKVGVIDSDYRGEIMVCLHNHSSETRTVSPNDRIAQLVLVPYEPAALYEVNELSDTIRGDGGFGHTGN